jgi:hypothetical protein
MLGCPHHWELVLRPYEEKGMEINIGIAEQDRAAIAEGLSRLLAD